MNNKQRGTLLLEVLVAAMVLGTIIMSAAAALGVSLDGATSAKMQSSATFLLQEELEPLGAIRDSGWVNIATNGTYYVAPLGSSWTLTPTTTGEVVGDFTRSVVISDVFRDDNGQIVESGGSVDPSTKKAVATVSWQSFLPHAISATTYITRYKNNLVWLQTTEAEFNLGTKNGVNVVNTAGGEVVLGSGGNADWCEPDLSIAGLDLPKSGVANAVTAIEGRAFAGTGNNSSGESFVNINITNAHPPVATVLETFDGYKTNDVFGEANYGYIATDTNTKEVVIINLSSVPYTEVGYFNAPGNTDANSVFIAGSVGYMTAGNKLYNFDLSSKTGSRPALDADGATISATGTSVVVAGNYAIVSIAGHARELEIFDISNPSNINRVGWADVNGEAARDVFINSSATRAYIVTDASATLPEFFIIDISNKNCSDCSDIGQYNAGSSVSLKAVEVVPGGRAILIGQGGEEYQVIDISDETNPVRCGGMQVDSGINDSASILEGDNDAYSYILTGDASNEFRMIEGGPGGVYSASGVFESSTLDAGGTTAFNRIDVTVNKPVNTDITFQVAGADVGGGGTCATATFSFVGPDGSGASYFTDDGAVPLSDDGSGFENPARCFRYRAFLTTSDFGATPSLFDFTLNYSP